VAKEPAEKSSSRRVGAKEKRHTNLPHQTAGAGKKNEDRLPSLIASAWWSFEREQRPAERTQPLQLSEKKPRKSQALFFHENDLGQKKKASKGLQQRGEREVGGAFEDS